MLHPTGQTYHSCAQTPETVNIVLHVFSFVFHMFSARTTHLLIDLGLIWAYIENKNENGKEMNLDENTRKSFKRMKMNGNEKTELKLLRKSTLINWSGALQLRAKT